MVIKLITAGLLLTFLLAVFRREDKGPEDIVFETEMGPVVFWHARHQGRLDCAVCHHLVGATEKQPCRDCHKKKAARSREDPVSFFDVKIYFCRGCHLDKREDDRTARAPIYCKECHDITRMP